MDIKLDVYQGSLDLLLTLIRRHKIDIYDIPIAQLTDQYLAEVANLPPDMEQLSEFLVMAATLLEIKSRMLLPRPKPEGAEPSEDPRQALVEKLVAYKQAQALAAELSNLTPLGERITNSGDIPLLSHIKKGYSTMPDLDTEQISTSHLLDIFIGIMSRKEERRDVVRAGYGKVARDRFTLEEKVVHMRQLLESYGRISLEFLFSHCQSKGEMVVTFLAMLEMIRQGEVSAVQTTPFGDVGLAPRRSHTP